MILFVEDDSKDRQLIQSVLAQWEHKERIVFVSDGTHAWEFLNHAGNKLPNVVVIDLKMPRLDGIGLLKQIRNEVRFDILPVVIFSSSAAQPDISECYCSGANAYVIKALGFVEFSAAVKSIVNFWIHTNEQGLNACVVERASRE